MAKKPVRKAPKPKAPAKKAPAAAKRPAPAPAAPAPSKAPGAPPAALELLEALSNAVAVSGDEGAVRRIVLEAIQDHVDDVRVDALGNVIATREGKGNFRVLVTAHMDEVGFMVTSIESDGTCRFDAVGNVDERQLLGKAVWIGKGRVPGVIGAKPIHLTKPNERTTVVKADAMRIDVGATNRDAAQSLVKVGDRGSFATPFADLGAALRGKALDNRIGCATLVELLKAGPYDADLVAAFTVQEEVGLRGARVAGYTVDPDAAVVLDCTPANDLPAWDGSENVTYNSKFGEGPAIYLSDRNVISDQALINHFTRTAEAARIPYQFRQPGGGGTDAGGIQLAKKGVPTISVSVPGRYLHTAAALVSTDDWRHTVRLVQAALSGLNAKALKR